MNIRGAVKHSDFVRLMIDEGPSLPAQDPRTITTTTSGYVSYDPNSVTYTIRWAGNVFTTNSWTIGWS